jgi:transposase
MFHGSNNQKTFGEFAKQLLKKVSGRATVYLDNLTVHHSNVITDLFSERVDLRYLPPYSCVLNPIERLWNLIKQQWRKKMVGSKGMKDEEAIETLT